MTPQCVFSSLAKLQSTWLQANSLHIRETGLSLYFGARCFAECPGVGNDETLYVFLWSYLGKKANNEPRLLRSGHREDPPSPHEEATFALDSSEQIITHGPSTDGVLHPKYDSPASFQGLGKVMERGAEKARMCQQLGRTSKKEHHRDVVAVAHLNSEQLCVPEYDLNSMQHG